LIFFLIQKMQCHPKTGFNPVQQRRQRRQIQLVNVGIVPLNEKPMLLRIPAKATMDSDAWRPVDPVDDNQGGA